MIDEKTRADATYWAKDTAKKVREGLAGFDTDSHKEGRIKACECKTCFYLRRPVVAGRAISTVRCRECEEEFRWPDTAVPKLCDGCSIRLHACHRCLADMEPL